MARIFVTSRQLCLGGWCQLYVCSNIMIRGDVKIHWQSLQTFAKV